MNQTERRTEAWREAMPKPIVTVTMTAAQYDRYVSELHPDDVPETQRMLAAGVIILTQQTGTES